MALVFDAQAQVQTASEVDGQLDLSHIGHIDDVRRHTAECAGRICGAETWGQARHALEERPVDTGGLR